MAGHGLLGFSNLGKRNGSSRLDLLKKNLHRFARCAALISYRFFLLLFLILRLNKLTLFPSGTKSERLWQTKENRNLSVGKWSGRNAFYCCHKSRGPLSAPFRILSVFPNGIPILFNNTLNCQSRETKLSCCYCTRNAPLSYLLSLSYSIDNMKFFQSNYLSLSLVSKHKHRQGKRKRSSADAGFTGPNNKSISAFDAGVLYKL